MDGSRRQAGPARSSRSEAVAAASEWRFAAAALRRLPPRVALFNLRARRVARQTADAFSLQSALRPAKLATLLDAAAGRSVLVELGTGTAWTTIALALADPNRTILSYDILERERAPYLALVPDWCGRGSSSSRRPPKMARAMSAASSCCSSRALTSAIRRSPRSPSGGPAGPGALVVFDDYGHPDYPGVAEAVAALGATGTVRASMFLWRPA